MDAVERFKSEPSSPSLGFRGVHGLPSYFVIYTRHGDLCILRQMSGARYLAVDVGPYARVMDRAGLSAGSQIAPNSRHATRRGMTHAP